MGNKIKQYQKIRQALAGTILVDEPLSEHTSFRIGGPADVYYYPPDIENLGLALELCREEGLFWFVIGSGTDLLVSDEGFKGMVIDLSQGFGDITSEGYRASAGAGVVLEKFLTHLKEHGLSGMERLSGIPGRIGGCVRLNAGAFGAEIGDRLSDVKLLDARGAVVHFQNREIQMGYRYTSLPSDGVVVEATFVLADGNPKEIEKIQQEILSQRKEKQPLSLPSAGSVFKRPPGDYAGRLIEDAGCKGLRIGDAMVSKKHANFIVNVHLATARDVMRLIEDVREKVLKRFGVALELEIQMVGFSE